MSTVDADPGGSGRKYLLIASTGGHLAQLDRIAGAMRCSEDSLWVTFDSPQSRTLLADRRVVTVPYVSPRDWRGVLRALRIILRATRGETFDRAVSTGAALALAGFAAAGLKRVPRLYIESVSRVRGPSVTGRLVAGLRLASLQTQHRGWAGARWAYRGSVLTGYAPTGPVARDDGLPAARPPRIFVSLGTIRPYRFDAAVRAVVATGLVSETTVWQLGCTTAEGLPGRVLSEISGAELERCARAADVVVTHAGVGTVLQLLEWGVRPVVLVRSAERGEHVDDHQRQIGEVLREHDLATVAEAPDLVAADLTGAVGRRVVVRHGRPDARRGRGGAARRRGAGPRPARADPEPVGAYRQSDDLYF